jgi:hypothetical protein
VFNVLKAWRLGAHRITEDHIEKLRRIKPKGWFIEVIPSLEDKPSFILTPLICLFIL